MNPAEARETSRSGAAEGPARAVVLTAADAAPPSALMRALGRKGVAAVLSADEPAVMVELARGPALAVVLADGDPSERQATRRELLAAVRRYYPATAVWHYGRDAAGEPTLSVLGATERTPERGSHRTPERVPPRRTPPQTAAPRVEPRGDVTPPGSDSEMISEEELRMLLDPAPLAGSDPSRRDSSRRED